MVDKKGVKIPLLDFTSIFLQREATADPVPPKAEQMYEESEEEVVSVAPTDQFEQEKLKFKMKMLSS